jgi:hypothetical protein
MVERVERSGAVAATQELVTTDEHNSGTDAACAHPQQQALIDLTDRAATQVSAQVLAGDGS